MEIDKGVLWFEKEISIDNRFINLRIGKRCTLYFSYDFLVYMKDKGYADNYILGVSDDLNYLFIRKGDGINNQRISLPKGKNSGKVIIATVAMRKFLLSKVKEAGYRYTYYNEENEIITMKKDYELKEGETHFPYKSPF